MHKLHFWATHERSFVYSIQNKCSGFAYYRYRHAANCLFGALGLDRDPYLDWSVGSLQPNPESQGDPYGVQERQKCRARKVHSKFDFVKGSLTLDF
jgi:hypothetical protein